jgi:glutamyl-Q tRNA(Asp) synthetase
MEDIDPPREQPGAADEILRQLESHGLCWDGAVLYQSQRLEAYEDVIATFRRQKAIYACECSRQQVQAMGGIYNGCCRNRCGIPEAGNALRFKVPADCCVAFDDLFCGRQQQNLATEVGDFVIRRRDGLHAYQLAVVVDDIYQSISHVIRGADLLDSTCRQICLFEQLAATPPRYGHLPLALNAEGQKLSKQNLAISLSAFSPWQNLSRALCWLGFEGVPVEGQLSLEELLVWATTHWRRQQVAALHDRPAPPGY